jgi:hypothetical protein
MVCSTCGNEVTGGEGCATCEATPLSRDAQAAESWAPDPGQPTDFKATFIATPEIAPKPSDDDVHTGGLNTTWLTLGLLVAFSMGVVFYLINGQ